MQEVNRQIWVWQNGTLRPATAKPGAFPLVREFVPLTRRGNGAWCLFRLEDHLQRLLQATRRVGYDLPCNAEALRAATLATAASFVETATALLASGEARVTLSLHAAADQDGARPGPHPNTECQLALELSPGAVTSPTGSAKPQLLSEPVSVSFSVEDLAASNSLGNLTVNAAWLAHRAAQRNGCFTALLRDALGRVSGSAFASVFCASGTRLITPHLACGAFPGLTRDTLMTLAQESGFDVSEQEITREMLLRSNEVFLASSAYGLMPVQHVDRNALGVSSPGPVTQRLAERYADVLFGTDGNHPEWLWLAC